MSHVQILPGFFFVVLLLSFLCLVFISPEKLFHKEGIEAKYRPSLIFVQPCNQKQIFFLPVSVQSLLKKRSHLLGLPTQPLGQLPWWGKGERTEGLVTGWSFLGHVSIPVYSGLWLEGSGRIAMQSQKMRSLLRFFGSEKQDEDFKLFPNLALDLGNRHIRTLH